MTVDEALRQVIENGGVIGLEHKPLVDLARELERRVKRHDDDPTWLEQPSPLKNVDTYASGDTKGKTDENT